MVFFYMALLYFYVTTITERIIKSDDPSRWKLPISDVTVINITYSPNYEIAWMYQSCAVTIASSGFVMTDFLVAALLVDLTTQYKILRMRMQRTFQELAVTDDTSNLSWPHLHHLIKQCVTHHLSILKLTSDVEEVCSTLVFIGVIAGLSVTSFSIYYASVLPPLDFKALQSYLEAGMIILALFYLCYCGTQLSEASQSLASACYETNFIGTDVRFQKDLAFIIMRSQRPIKITVGKFVGLSIGIFTFVSSL
ncbi:hypothetical protein ILUMI_10421 [Ignelater luminosus]|uniref:Uncharacterized protein n=1 Tax=Ignelater luminosus TaxID=2038154 RepID=A0A8K0GEZ9_IGNLU|nr:hypothetical protein ILUMI_10421 [Ignelater luminosus]